MNNFKDEVLRELGLQEIPSETTIGSAFEGLAVILVRKVSGEDLYAIGKWNKDIKKLVIAHDFRKGMVEKIISVFPIPQPKKVDLVAESLKAAKLRLVDMGYAKTAVKVMNTAKVEKELKEIDEAKLNLEDKGVEDPRGTLTELTAQLAAIDV